MRQELDTKTEKEFISGTGLSKREYFASMRRFESISPENAKLLMGKDPPEYGTIEYLRYSAEAIEKLSVLAADALIKALNKTN